MFKPDRILFEQDALTYPKGEKLYQEFKEKGEKIEILNTANRVTSIPGENKREVQRLPYLKARLLQTLHQ